MSKDDSRVVQVSNVAHGVTRDLMKIMFGYLGKIDDLRLYPTVRHDVARPAQLKVCYIKFAEKSTAGIALYMTGTVLFNRALIVTPEESGEIPAEDFALAITQNGTIMPDLCPSKGFLPLHVITTVKTIESQEMAVTLDPTLEANGLPEYPPLPASYDSQTIEAIRQTVQIEAVDSSICNEDYLRFFDRVAEVKYMCRYKSTSSSNDYLLVEFSNQPSIIEALKLNGKELKGKPIKIVHATQAIVKPDNEAMQNKIVEALSSSEASERLGSSRRSRSRSLTRRKRSRSKKRSCSKSSERKRTHRRSRSRSRKRRSKDRNNSHKDNVKLEEKRSDRRHSVSQKKHRSRSRNRKRSRSHNRRSRSHSKSRSSKRKHDKEHHRRR